MKYWHTEFHIVDIYVDDYVSFADLDYLELLFRSEYAGIYKGLFAKSHFHRKRPHDLYIQLMKINNNRLNYFFNDRFFMPGWLRMGLFGIVISGIGKKIAAFRNRIAGNDAFDMVKWSGSFYKKFDEEINRPTDVFDKETIKQQLLAVNSDSGMSYRFNRAISLKIWLQNKNLI
jgi:hypothetical protein